MGRNTFLAIQILGTRWLPALFGVKGWFDALNAQLSLLPRDLSVWDENVARPASSGLLYWSDREGKDVF